MQTYPTYLHPAVRLAGALLTLLLLLLVFITPAQATQPDENGEHKVGICHRTASDTNPYVYIVVDVASLSPGHLDNADPGHKPTFWKTDGTFRGVGHEAGDPKDDYLAEDASQCNDMKPNASPTPSVEPSSSPSPTPSPTPSVSPSESPTPSPTVTPEPSTSPSPTPTSQPSPTPEPTVTPSPTSTPVTTPTPEPTLPPTDMEALPPAGDPGWGVAFAVAVLVSATLILDNRTQRRRRR